jgi:hypothetical protein
LLSLTLFLILGFTIKLMPTADGIPSLALVSTVTTETVAIAIADEFVGIIPWVSQYSIPSITVSVGLNPQGGPSITGSTLLNWLDGYSHIEQYSTIGVDLPT